MSELSDYRIKEMAGDAFEVLMQSGVDTFALECIIRGVIAELKAQPSPIAPQAVDMQWSDPIKGLAIGDSWQSETPIGNYQLHDHVAGKLRFALYFHGKQMGKFSTLANAHTGAQRDFNSRIAKSCKATPIANTPAVPDANNRTFVTHECWINELGLLGDKPDLGSGWVRNAIRTIYRGLLATPSGDVK